VLKKALNIVKTHKILGHFDNLPRRMLQLLDKLLKSDVFQIQIDVR